MKNVSNSKEENGGKVRWRERRKREIVKEECV